MPNKTALPKIAAVQPIKFVPEPNYPSVYTNNIGMGTSVYDVTLLFGEIIGSVGTNLDVVQRVKVNMSLGQAKILAALIWGQINLYEASLGEIRVPAEALPHELHAAMKALFPNWNKAKDES